VKCWLPKKSKRSRSVPGYGVRMPSERSPRGVKEGNEIRSGGMIFWNVLRGRLRLKCDGTRAETRVRLSAKRTSPFKSAGT
jgi:hypothetical protein